MGFTYSMLSLAVTLCTSIISTFLYRAIFRPYGWTRKGNDGVAVRFKVFLPLYLKNPEKWVLMSDAARYEKMMVYFSSGLEWRKYNRWRKRAEKERMKRQQEERKQKFFNMIFEDYKPKPNPKFTPPPTVKPKDQRDKLTSGERDKILADLMYFQNNSEELNAIIKEFADSKDWGINPMELAVKAAIEEHQAKKPGPRCKDCKHMRYRHNDNGKIDTVCVKHKTACGFEPIFPAMVACGVFEERRKEVRDYGKWTAARDAILHSVKTEQIPTGEHYE